MSGSELPADVIITVPCGCTVALIGGSPNHSRMKAACKDHAKLQIFDQFRVLREAEIIYGQAQSQNFLSGLRSGGSGDLGTGQDI